MYIPLLGTKPAGSRWICLCVCLAEAMSQNSSQDLKSASWRVGCKASLCSLYDTLRCFAGMLHIVHHWTRYHRVQKGNESARDCLRTLIDPACFSGNAWHANSSLYTIHVVSTVPACPLHACVENWSCGKAHLRLDSASLASSIKVFDILVCTRESLPCAIHGYDDT